jgi:alpha,alpha-trehalase
MGGLPIAEYALLSDCHSAALVSRDGSIDWLCAPRFDSPSIFARLLDDRAGHWRLGARGEHRATRRYIDATLVLETTIETATGSAVVVDAMAMGADERGHQLGRSAPGILVRHVTATAGEIDLELDYRPRSEYGRIRPLMSPVDGAVVARGGADVLVLSSTISLQLARAVAAAPFTLRAGESAFFALAHSTSWDPVPAPLTATAMQRLIDQTLAAWRSWSELHQRYEGPWRHLVHHSGRVLQGLTFQPTGAIVAAPTTSLPESPGGERNWDYRYTWVRDASLTMDALWVAACPDEAQRFFGWMTNAVASQISLGEDLQIMFGVGGERDLSERELPHLSGWRDSRPVRIGNGAWTQRQIDVYGELLSAARSLAGQLGDLDAASKRFLIDAAECSAVKWTDKDQGIWEIRGEPRHFLYSKLMCWLALDSAIALAPRLDATSRIDSWRAKRDEIHRAILDQGWSDSAQAFTQSFGGDDLDASNLMLPIVGFLPGDDPRMRSTMEAIATRLTDERGLVYRYRASDGLAGDEGTFLLCTFWLAQAQAIIGDVDRATTTMERAITFANDVGLLAEEVDPASGELLGNFPQAFSHIGLINAAWAISRAREGRPVDEPAEVM